METFYSGTTLEGFEVLIEDDEVVNNSEEAETATSYLWFSPTFADAADYAGRNPHGAEGYTDIVLEVEVPEKEIESKWCEKSLGEDTVLRRDTKYPEYLRTESYPVSWVQGYWRIDELSMGMPEPDNFSYFEIEE